MEKHFVRSSQNIYEKIDLTEFLLKILDFDSTLEKFRENNLYFCM